MTDPVSPSYEAARDELAELVRTLEAGGTTLEQSLALWERGEALAHVRRLEVEGRAVRAVEDGVWWWRTV